MVEFQKAYQILYIVYQILIDFSIKHLCTYIKIDAICVKLHI